MKKISGIIVMIFLIGAIVFGLGYKMASPDGWDRLVETIISPSTQSTPTPTPTPEPTPSKKPVEHQAPVVNQPSTGGNNTQVVSPSISPSPSVSPSPSISPSPSVEPEVEKTEYEQYMDMTGAEQQKIFESFENPRDFFEWYNNAKAEYDSKNESIIIDGGSINLEDYIKDNSNS